MIKLDENKLAKLRSSSERLTEKYGEPGSPEREEFEARAKAYYYAELLKEILSVETVICSFLLLCRLQML